MYHVSFICACGDGHVGWLHLLAVHSRTFVYKFIFEYLFSMLLGLYPGVGLLDRMIILYLTYWGTTTLSPQQYMKVPTVPYPCHHLLFNLKTIIIVVLWGKGHVTVLWICIFLVTDDTEHLSSCPVVVYTAFLVFYQHAVQPWARHFPPLSFSLLVCQGGIWTRSMAFKLLCPRDP